MFEGSGGPGTVRLPEIAGGTVAVTKVVTVLPKGGAIATGIVTVTVVEILLAG